jgi:hypothetical protein
MFATFQGGDPLRAALDIQWGLASEDWGPVHELRVRVALHAGEAVKQSGDYFGPAVNRAHRVLEVGWGGQILLTPEVASRWPLPPGAWLDDLGEHLLKDLSAPQRITWLRHPDLPLQEFPPLRSLSARPQDLPDALRTAVKLHLDSLATYALTGMARLLVGQGQMSRAITVLAFVLTHSGTSLLARTQAREMFEELRAALPADVFEGAVEAARGRSLEDIVAEVVG